MTSIGNITFACEDPTALAEFWAATLDYVMEELPPELEAAWRDAGRDPNAAAAIVDPDDKGPRLFFKKMNKTETDSMPIHLDLNTTDREATVRRLVELGAKKRETKSQQTGPLTETWTVMEDPEGNGFCVQSPGAE